jgi:hypothetical protein
LANKDGFNSGANITFQTDSVSISQLIMAPSGGLDSTIPSTHLISLLMTIQNDGNVVEYKGGKSGIDTECLVLPCHLLQILLIRTRLYIASSCDTDPVSKVYFPIYDSFDEGRKPVAIMLAWMKWANYFENVLAPTLRGIYVVIKGCDREYTYLVDGREVHLVGPGDLHDGQYNHLKQTTDFSNVGTIADGTEFGLPLNKDFCPISLDIYPSKTFEDTFSSSTPITMTMAVAIVFAFTAFMFVVYDRLVERRQNLVMRKAQQTTAIVASLFPENVRERLMEQAANKLDEKNFVSQNRRLKGYLNGSDADASGDTPIAGK